LLTSPHILGKLAFLSFLSLAPLLARDYLRTWFTPDPALGSGAGDDVLERSEKADGDEDLNDDDDDDDGDDDKRQRRQQRRSGATWWVREWRRGNLGLSRGSRPRGPWTAAATREHERVSLELILNEKEELTICEASGLEQDEAEARRLLLS
jgi:hypothetical protein